MVSVTGKAVTHRIAIAQAVVTLPAAAAKLFARGELRTKKGPVFQTALLAGVLGAKRAAELIPLCHTIPIENCQVDIQLRRKRDVVIECRVETHHKTGVEMEALTGASIAALTVYDMCKSLSHGIVIKDLRLLEKRGGKKDFKTAN
jgi:cyclic pyranopterin phosphate synthase